MAGKRICITCAGLLVASLNSASADPPHLRAARSLVAEAGLLFRLHSQERLTETYVSETQTIIQDQLQSELPSLAPEESQLVRAALVAIRARDTHKLDTIQQQLTHLVDRREQSY